LRNREHRVGEGDARFSGTAKVDGKNTLLRILDRNVGWTNPFKYLVSHDRKLGTRFERTVGKGEVTPARDIFIVGRHWDAKSYRKIGFSFFLGNVIVAADVHERIDVTLLYRRGDTMELRLRLRGRHVRGVLHDLDAEFRRLLLHLSVVFAGNRGNLESFSENAELKARAASLASGLPALADDSGLCVDALSGQPGIHSARWAGPSKDFSAAMARVYKELETLNVKNPRARFICALSLAWPDGHVETCLGRVDGALVFPPRGTKGFGYDPIFLPDGYNVTFGEMEPGEKHKISHRARAFQKLVKACLDD